MTQYKKKRCSTCGKFFTPINPNQKYCGEECKSIGKRNKDRERDRKRSREKHGYQKYTRNCLACGKEFTTYYSKKVYCGDDNCELVRISRKNRSTQLHRDKESERIRKLTYYRTTKKDRLLQKAEKYREVNPEAKEYVSGKIHRHTIDDVREYVSKFGYELLSKSYENNRSKILLRCPNGHEWETTFHNFRDNGGNQGNRCLYCYLENNYTSRPEQKVLNYFTDNYPNINIVHNDRSQISPLEIDIYFPDYKVGVEVCGLYWHGEISGGKKRSYHYDKMMSCYEAGIRLITVFEDEVRDKFDIVISRVLQALYLTRKRIFARKCVVREIDTGVANKFFEKYHIQGKTQSIMAWGLFYDNDLVQVCSVGKFVRKHASGDNLVELKRFCSKNEVFVVGGFSKLFNQVIKYCKNFGYSGIKSYCDMRYANIFTPIYEKVGFDLVGSTKYTPHYFRNGVRYRNFSLRKTPEERSSGKTEFELRLEQGYDRIWDCGHRTYLYNI